MNIQRLFITAAFLVAFVLFGGSQAFAGAPEPPRFEQDPAVAECLDGGDTALKGSVSGLSKGKKKSTYDVSVKLFKERSVVYTDSTTASKKAPEFAFDLSGLSTGEYLGVVTVTSKKDKKGKKGTPKSAVVKTWNVPLTIQLRQDCPTLSEVAVNPDAVANTCPAHTAEVEITGQVTNHDPSLLSTLTVEVFTAGDGLEGDLVESDPHVVIAPDGSFNASFSGLAAGSYYASVGAPEVGEPGGTAFDVHTHDCPEFTSLAFHPDVVGNDCPATNAHAAITHHDPGPSSTVGVELFKNGSTQALGEATQVEVDERGKFIHHIGGLEKGRYTATATITHSGERIDQAHATVDVATDDCPLSSARGPASTPSEPSESPSTPEPTPPTGSQPATLFTSIEVDTLPVGEDEELAQTGASHGGLVLFGLALGGAGLLLLRRSRGL